MADYRKCESSLDTSRRDLYDNLICGGFGRIGNGPRNGVQFNSQRSQPQIQIPPPPPPEPPEDLDESVIKLFSADSTYEKASDVLGNQRDVHGKGSTNAAEIKQKCDDSNMEYMRASLDGKSRADLDKIPRCRAILVQKSQVYYYPEYDEQTKKVTDVRNVDKLQRDYMEVNHDAEGKWDIYKNAHGLIKSFGVDQYAKEKIAR